MSASATAPAVSRPAGPESEAGAPVFVWVVWLVMTLAAFAYVARYGSALPNLDEWEAVLPLCVGAQPINAATLWAQHNEARYPLLRLLYLSLLKVSGYDFRAGMFVQ